jgi:hypothetical protein
MTSFPSSPQHFHTELRNFGRGGEESSGANSEANGDCQEYQITNLEKCRLSGRIKAIDRQQHQTYKYKIK